MFWSYVQYRVLPGMLFLAHFVNYVCPWACFPNVVACCYRRNGPLLQYKHFSVFSFIMARLQRESYWNEAKAGWKIRFGSDWGWMVSYLGRTLSKGIVLHGEDEFFVYWILSQCRRNQITTPSLHIARACSCLMRIWPRLCLMGHGESRQGRSFVYDNDFQKNSHKDFLIFARKFVGCFDRFCLAPDACSCQNPFFKSPSQRFEPFFLFVFFSSLFSDPSNCCQPKADFPSNRYILICLVFLIAFRCESFVIAESVLAPHPMDTIS